LQSFPNWGGGEDSSLWFGFAQQKAFVEEKVSVFASLKSIHARDAQSRNQGDQIGRAITRWVILYFGQFF
jgi:hypothetical protein